MSRPLRIMALQTPAGVYGVTETETVYGGRMKTLGLLHTVWGDFRPQTPAVEATADGDACVVQEADFICRSADGVSRGTVLNLRGFDWTVRSLDEQADGAFRLRLERVHA